MAGGKPEKDGKLHHKEFLGAGKKAETALVVASWFFLNIAMASSTKWIFVYGQICTEGKASECRTYRFPLAITVIHMVFSWVVCHVHIYYIRGAPAGFGLTIAQQFEKVAPLSVCFALSVAMGNLSLKYIYPSFNQMLGAMSPLITVLMAVVIQQKRYNRWTWLSMPIICGGLAVCSMKEVNFVVLGAVYATGATILRAVKSIMQGRILTSSDKNLDSVGLLYYMAPWSAALLLVLVLVAEGTEPLSMLASSGTYAHPLRGRYHLMFLLLLSGLNACLLNVANFLVTSYTSPVTLQVLGNVKSCLSIGVSVAIFRNALKLEQALGVATCLFGVWLYNEKGGAVNPCATVAPEKATTLREIQAPSGDQGVVASIATSNPNVSVKRSGSGSLKG